MLYEHLVAVQLWRSFTLLRLSARHCLSIASGRWGHLAVTLQSYQHTP
jgi:hypothetical protein